MPLPKNMKPRPYQYQLFHMIREAFIENNAVLAEAATGSGKSVLMALIVDSFLELNKRRFLDRHVYFLVDEKFLLYQFSEHLNKWGIPHDIIGDGKREGRPVNVHVCTIQTLAKRPPEKDPALFIIDEAHFSTSDRYMEIFYMFPEAKKLGLTASAETGAGKGLACNWIDGKNEGNGIFDILIESPVTMRQLTEGIEITDEADVTTLETYLVPIKYYGVPIKGIEDLHLQTGEYKNGEVDELLKKGGTFGNSITEMQKFSDVQSHILYFCKSVKACYDMEIFLNDAGYTTAVLEGSVTRKNRKRIMSDFGSGKAQILITCKMVLKGVDLPYLLMSVDLAPTPSRGTLRQKIGRGTRKHEGKEVFIYLDMVGNFRCLPGYDIYADINWNFDSKKYNKKPSESGQENVCPICYYLIPIGQVKCPECGADKPKPVIKEKKKGHLDGELIEITPKPLRDRTEEDRSDINRQISKALVDNDLEALVEIGLTLTSKKALWRWMYYKLRTTEGIVDVETLYKIKRVLKYKNGWVRFARTQIKEG